MAVVDTLIENGTVITMDPDRRVLKESSVAIKGKHIVDIGPAAELKKKHSAKKRIDARRHVIMPGLVDLHSHGATSILRSLGEDEQFSSPHRSGLEWRNLMNFIAHHSSAEWYYVESLLASLEKLKFGVTCSNYMLGCAPRGDNPEHLIKSAEGAEKIGIRSVVGVGPSMPPWPREYSYWENGKRIDRMVTLEESFEATSEAIGSWKERQSDTVEMWVSVSRFMNPNPADPIADDTFVKYIEPQAAGVREIMEKHDVGFHLHAFGNSVKFSYGAGQGLLGPKTVLGHGWPFDLETVEILAETGARVAHCPRARRVYLQKGRCPVPEMIDAGVIVGLGSDAPILDRTYNLWEDMYLAPRWQRFVFNDGSLIPEGKSLEMATIDGARALNLDAKIGSIEIGKCADVILLNLFQPHLMPVFMETSRMVNYARGADVETVIVNGTVLMENREVKSVDEAEILEWAQQHFEDTVSKFGLQPLVERPLLTPDRYWRTSSTKKPA